MPATASDIQTRIDEAEAALHEIVVDGLSSSTTATGETYTAHDTDRLRRYIDDLYARLAEVQAVDDGGGYGFEPLTIVGSG